MTNPPGYNDIIERFVRLRIEAAEGLERLQLSSAVVLPMPVVATSDTAPAASSAP